MRKDEGKEKIINMKTKTMSNIFKKIIACLVLVAMFSGYMLPVREVFAMYQGAKVQVATYEKSTIDAILNGLNGHWNEFCNRNKDKNYNDAENGFHKVDKTKDGIWFITYPEVFTKWLNYNEKELVLSGINASMWQNNGALAEFNKLEIKKITFDNSHIGARAIVHAYETGYFKGVDNIEFKGNSSVDFDFGYYPNAEDQDVLYDSKFWQVKMSNHLPSVRMLNKDGTVSNIALNGVYNREIYPVVKNDKGEIESICDPIIKRTVLGAEIQLTFLEDEIETESGEKYILIDSENKKKSIIRNYISMKHLVFYKKQKGENPKTKDQETGGNGTGGSTTGGETGGNTGGGSTDDIKIEDIEDLFASMPDVSIKRFKENIRDAKNGSTRDLNNFMYLNDNYFANRIGQDGFNRLCKYVEKETKLKYYHNLPIINYLNDVEEESGPSRIINISYKGVDENTDEMVCTGWNSLEGEEGISEGQVYLEVYDSASNCLKGEYGANEEVELRYKPEKSGTYWFICYNEYGTRVNADPVYYEVDTEKPEIQTWQEYDEEYQGYKLHVWVYDDRKLGNLTILKDGQEYKKESFEGINVKNLTYDLNESGKYELKVIDSNGNEEKTTVEVNIDKEAPKNINVEVKKYEGNNEIEKKNIVVKEGDYVTLKISADKEFRFGHSENYNQGHHNPAIKLVTGSEADGGDYTIQYAMDYDPYRKTDNSVEAKNYYEFTFEITDDIINDLKLKNQSGKVKIVLDDVRNNYNYKANAEDCIFVDAFEIDDKVPELTRAELSRIDGKGRSDIDKYNYIEQDSKYKISLYFSEELGKNPTIKVGNLEATTKYYGTEYRGESEAYIYYADIDCNDLINNANLEKNKEVSVSVLNIVDIAGNVADNIGNCNFDGGNKLYYGITGEKIYIASDKKEFNSGKGDINGDGFINDYDYLLLQRYLTGFKNELDEDELERADVEDDKKGTNIDRNDFTALRNKIKMTQNNFYTEQDYNFIIYNNDNTVIDPDKVNWEIKDNEGNSLIGNGVTITKTGKTDREGNKVCVIKFSNSVKEKAPITIKVSSAGMIDGTMTLEDGTKEGEYKADEHSIAISIKPDSNTPDDGDAEVQYRKGDVNNDGRITVKDALMILRYSVGLEYFDGKSKFAEDIDKEGVQFKAADIDNDGKVETSDAMRVQRIAVGLDKSNKIWNEVVPNVRKGGTYILELNKMKGSGDTSENTSAETVECTIGDLKITIYSNGSIDPGNTSIDSTKYISYYRNKRRKNRNICTRWI